MTAKITLHRSSMFWAFVCLFVVVGSKKEVEGQNAREPPDVIEPESGPVARQIHPFPAYRQHNSLSHSKQLEGRPNTR